MADNERNCSSCKHQEEMTKHPFDRCTNCQQCAAAEGCIGIKYPNWEPYNGR